jgi:hypothetical protein
MSQSEILQLLLTLSVPLAVSLLVYCSYKALALIADEQERLRDIAARKEHRERLERLRRQIMPRLRPLGWKRVNLARPMNLPRVRNRRIRIHILTTKSTAYHSRMH